MTIKTAASYARISEKVERDKVSDQHKQNEAHAKARGYRIVARFTDDGISALGHKVREGFRDMLAAAERGEFEVIVATEEERLARNVHEKLELHEACVVAGVTWDTARDGFVDPDTDSGEFMSTIRAAMGRIESKRKARRQLAANIARVEDGYPVPGKTRYGFKHGNIELEPHEAKNIEALFKDFLVGASIRSLSLRMGWRALRVRETLTNPAYAGWVVRRGERFDAHEGVGRIIDRDTFEAVQGLLKAPERRTTPGPTPRHPLSGIARCGACGGPLTYRNNYLCTANLSHPCINKTTLEQQVRKEVVDALIFGIHEELPETSRLHQIDRRQVEIEVAKSELLASIEHGARAADIGPGLGRLEKEYVHLGEERDRIVSASVTLSMLADLRGEIFAGARASFESAAKAKATLAERYDALSLQQQRDLIRGMVTITVYNGRTVDRIEVTVRGQIEDDAA